jgi:hypothetical protein
VERAENDRRAELRRAFEAEHNANASAAAPDAAAKEG